jgi:hypothetical protein
MRCFLLLESIKHARSEPLPVPDSRDSELIKENGAGGV